jgi:hypothetical protein
MKSNHEDTPKTREDEDWEDTPATSYWEVPGLNIGTREWLF